MQFTRFGAYNDDMYMMGPWVSSETNRILGFQYIS